ncbi:MAG: hypothetical protein ABWZ25_11395 [Chitinophagaceae bacterium]
MAVIYLVKRRTAFEL